MMVRGDVPTAADVTTSPPLSSPSLGSPPLPLLSSSKLKFLLSWNSASDTASVAVSQLTSLPVLGDARDALTLPLPPLRPRATRPVV
jgi:hypothetical protein